MIDVLLIIGLFALMSAIIGSSLIGLLVALARIQPIVFDEDEELDAKLEDQRDEDSRRY